MGALAEGSEVLATRETLALAGAAFAAATPWTVALKGLAAPVKVVTIRWR
ncbi:MAG: hypothetical protein M3O70_11785 [Actinomycetota bacterium]|nr:hypothetical protein [Actinomycetota bacterium]